MAKKDSITQAQADKLLKAFQEAGKEYGFDSVNAEFMGFREFKCRWQRTYGWADFRVSDYLKDAPIKVLKSLAKSIFKRITGEDDTFSPELKDWVTSEKFAPKHKKTYLSRCMDFSETSMGECRNLEDSVKRLVKAGLIPEDDTVTYRWSDIPLSQSVGNCSVLMRVVSINKVLDDERVPDDVLDYAVYYELCHILAGFNPSNLEQDKVTDALRAKYPNGYTARAELRNYSIML